MVPWEQELFLGVKDEELSMFMTARVKGKGSCEDEGVGA